MFLFTLFWCFLTPKKRGPFYMRCDADVAMAYHSICTHKWQYFNDSPSAMQLKLDTLRLLSQPFLSVPVGSPSHCGNVTVYVFNINQPSLPTPLYSVLVSVSLLWPFHSINSPNSSLLSHSVLPTLFLLYWSFQPYISLLTSLCVRPWCNPSLLTGLKAPTNSLTFLSP